MIQQSFLKIVIIIWSFTFKLPLNFLILFHPIYVFVFFVLLISLKSLFKNGPRFIFYFYMFVTTFIFEKVSEGNIFLVMFVNIWTEIEMLRYKKWNIQTDDVYIYKPRIIGGGGNVDLHNVVTLLVDHLYIYVCVVVESILTWIKSWNIFLSKENMKWSRYFWPFMRIFHIFRN